MKQQDGQEFLEKYGLTGLSQIVAAAIIKAEQSDPRAKKILFNAAIREICRISLGAGIEPSDLCHAAMTILEYSHAEVTRIGQAQAKQKQQELEREMAVLEDELTKKEP